MRRWTCLCRLGRVSPGAAVIGGAASLLLLAALYLAFLGGTTPARRESGIGGPFSLVAGNGSAVTDRDFRGRYLLIYFGYTQCRDVCPATLATVAAAMDGLGARAAQVQPLFISVDPARDTPAVVRRYAAAFSPALIGLTGSDAAIRDVLAEYRVTAHAESGTDAAQYTVDHTSVLYLVGPDGKFVAPLRADLDPHRMAAAILRWMG
jgi:protein SCO1